MAKEEEILVLASLFPPPSSEIVLVSCQDYEVYECFVAKIIDTYTSVIEL